MAKISIAFFFFWAQFISGIYGISFNKAEEMQGIHLKVYAMKYIHFLIFLLEHSFVIVFVFFSLGLKYPPAMSAVKNSMGTNSSRAYTGAAAEFTYYFAEHLQLK